MFIFLYLLSKTGNNINLSNGENITFIILCILELIIHIAPLVISIHVEKMYHQNKELKNELSEIKNLMILQNELLRNQQLYNQYYQQPNNTDNGSSSQY